MKKTRRRQEEDMKKTQRHQEEDMKKTRRRQEEDMKKTRRRRGHWTTEEYVRIEEEGRISTLFRALEGAAA
jgi:hypothetical protein